MIKSAVFLVLTVLSAVVFAADNADKKNSAYLDRQAHEVRKVVDLGYKFQTSDYKKLCQKDELGSECFKSQIASLHKADKLSVAGLIAALPAGKGLIRIEKEKAQKTKPKKSNSELNLAAHKKQAEFAIYLLDLSCTAATPKDWGVADDKTITSEKKSAENVSKTLKKVFAEEVEQVRKYSNEESIALQMKYDSTLLCGKK